MPMLCCDQDLSDSFQTWLKWTFLGGKKKAACKWKSTFKELPCTAQARPPQLLELHVPFRSLSCSVLQKCRNSEILQKTVSRFGCLSTNLMYDEGRFSTEKTVDSTFMAVLKRRLKYLQPIPSRNLSQWPSILLESDLYGCQWLYKSLIFSQPVFFLTCLSAYPTIPVSCSDTRKFLQDAISIPYFTEHRNCTASMFSCIKEKWQLRKLNSLKLSPQIQHSIFYFRSK